jgi:hypothetical protein
MIALLRVLHSASGFTSVTLSVDRMFTMHMTLPCCYCVQSMALIVQADMEQNSNVSCASI